jgi:antitoxin component YwqK of YwqJK toxin-antitoxin module
MADLNIAEIPHSSGNIKFRYSRYMSEGGIKWVRHGLFEAFHENGTLASSGIYEHGKENGIWRDYHKNGQLAAEGRYENGVEVGIWNYWKPDGNQEQ